MAAFRIAVPTALRITRRRRKVARRKAAVPAIINIAASSPAC
jgi:hypothetical protein